MSLTLGPGLTLTLIVIVAVLGTGLLSPLVFALFLRSHPPEGPPEEGEAGDGGSGNDGEADAAGSGDAEPGTVAADRDGG